jgi:16S rRNA (guanine527-N7)-methyltransferase
MEKAPVKLELIHKYFADLSLRQLAQFGKLDELYRTWNARINVISRKDLEHLYERHLLHSLSIAAVFSFGRNWEILDLGTGGGFPGIPLAIFFPEAKFHLVDSIAKKIKVVQAIADSIGLSNVSTEHVRAEQIGHRQFDAVVSRAVAPLRDLWSWSKPLLRNPPLTDPKDLQGRGLICLKGGDLAQEIESCGCQPRVISIFGLFPEVYFQEKYLLHVSPGGIY